MGEGDGSTVRYHAPPYATLCIVTFNNRFTGDIYDRRRKISEIGYYPCFILIRGASKHFYEPSTPFWQVLLGFKEQSTLVSTACTTVPRSVT